MTLSSSSLKKIRDTFSLKENVPMKDHTSFGVGGPADLFAVPESREEVAALVAMAGDEHLPVTFMGGGTNILVKDGGIRGLVISMKGLRGGIELRKIDKKKYRVTAPAGLLLARLAGFAMEKGLAGLGFCAGIPGTLGGAVMMNAGTALGTMSDVVVRVEVMGETGELRVIKRGELIFSRRSLKFCVPGWDVRNPVVLRVAVDLSPGAVVEELKAEWKALLNQRKTTQPVSSASGGCFFKNPKGAMAAGMLIDQAGLKGLKRGDAMVSDIHGNFIVNLGRATAADILSLKAIVEERVREKFGVTLETEVKIEGE